MVTWWKKASSLSWSHKCATACGSCWQALGKGLLPSTPPNLPTLGANQVFTPQCMGWTHALPPVHHAWLHLTIYKNTMGAGFEPIDHRKHGCNLEIATLKALCAVDPKQMQIEWQHGIVFLLLLTHPNPCWACKPMGWEPLWLFVPLHKSQGKGWTQSLSTAAGPGFELELNGLQMSILCKYKKSLWNTKHFGLQSVAPFWQLATCRHCCS